jgi:hypothetical protein
MTMMLPNLLISILAEFAVFSMSLYILLGRVAINID